MLVGSVTLVFHLLVPVLLLGWQARPGSGQTRAERLLKTIAVLEYWVLLLLAGVWMAVPRSLGFFYLGLSAAIAIRQTRRARFEGDQASSRRRLFTYGATAALFMAVIIHACLGRRPLAEKAVDLSFPLRDGAYSVISGGSNRFMNLHFMTLKAERYRHVRGQSYAVDIVKLNRFGIRSTHLWPEALADYEIFAAEVYAPCSGTVTHTRSSIPDLVPPDHDRVNLSGNFVALECKGVRILLAHLKQSSVRVRTGEQVTDGQPLAQVGNSGNTDEPHLHIHAERPSATASLLDAEPVQMRFDGRFLARNDAVERQ